MWSRRSHGWRIAALTVIGTAIVLPLVVFVLGPNMPPGKATAVAKSQVTDNTVLLVVMTPFTVFILAYLAYAIWAFRAPKGETELRDGPPIRGHMPSQLAWLATTTVAVLFLAIFGTTELLADNGSGSGSGPSPVAKPGGRQLPVQVIAQQWEFTYRYPTYGGVETADLVLPAGQEVAFHVTSLDAVHSFWAYELGVKADANPGVDNIAYVKTAKPGTFQIRCAELCGLWHGYMFDTGRIVSTADFKTWIDAQRKQFSGVSEVPTEVQPTAMPPTRSSEPDERAPPDRLQPAVGRRARRRRLLRRLVARAPDHRQEHRLLQRYPPKRHRALHRLPRRRDRVPGWDGLCELSRPATARQAAFSAREGAARRRPLLRPLHRPQGCWHPIPARHRSVHLHRRSERDADPLRTAAADPPRVERQQLPHVGRGARHDDDGDDDERDSRPVRELLRPPDDWRAAHGVPARSRR